MFMGPLFFIGPTLKAFEDEGKNEEETMKPR